MKKTALLLALSFFLVTFLNAQNDCTGNSHVDAVKQVKSKKVDYKPTNPYDCTKPNKTDDLMDSYSLDRFGMLMDSKSDWTLMPNVLANSQQNRGKKKYVSNLRNSFSASGTIVCCVPPRPDFEPDNLMNND